MGFTIWELRYADVVQMYKDGYYIEEIAEKHNLSIKTIYRILQKYGLLEKKQGKKKKRVFRRKLRKRLKYGIEVQKGTYVSKRPNEKDYYIRKYLTDISKTKYFACFRSLENVKAYCDEMDLIGWDYDRRYEIKDKVLQGGGDA